MKARITAALCLAAALLCGCGTAIDKNIQLADTRTVSETTSGEDIIATEDEDITSDEDITTPDEVIDDSPIIVPEEDKLPPDTILPTAEEQSAAQLLKYPPSNKPLDLSEGGTQNMVNRSLLYRGDDTRLAAKLKRAQDHPEEVTKICFLGDSITAGTGASDDSLKYVEQFRKWWDGTFDTPAEIINSGISATDSYCGVHRAYQDATGYAADIYVIEFINDEDEELFSETMDSLIRMCLSQPNDPAVILIEPARSSRAIPQPQHYKAATFYGVTEISYNNAILPEVEAGSCKWEDFMDDEVHPNDAGHALIARCLSSHFEFVMENIYRIGTLVKPFDVNSPSLAGDRFKGAVLGTRSTPSLVKVTDKGTFTGMTATKTFTNGWSTTEGGRIEFDISCKNLGILYREDIDGSYGKALVYVDYEPPVELNADCTGPVSFAEGEPVYSSDTEEMHHVLVEVIDNEEMNDFDILAWLIS